MKKKYTISLFGSGETIDGLKKSFNLNKNFELTHTVPDPSVDEVGFNKNFDSFKKSKKPDICLVSNYGKRIEYFDDDSLWLNIHAGLLPSYRGFSSNSWAILNNENEIGYTIHSIEYELDAGPIFYQKTFTIDKNIQYQSIRPQIINHIISKTPETCEKILKNKLIPTTQDESRARYCGKLKPEDGHIYDFSISSRHLYNIFRIFAKPLGTGIFYVKNAEKYEIENILLPKYHIEYKGIEGMVVNKTNNVHWIKSKDSVVGVVFSSLNKNIGSRF